MKKLASLVLFFLITFTATAQKVESNFTPLTDVMDYKVTFFTSFKTTSDPQFTYIAPKGYTYQSVVMEIKNNSQEDQKIDFTKIAIVDMNNKKYAAHHAVQSGKLGVSDKLTRNLGAGKTKTFVVEFWPAFPKDEVPRLLIDDQIVELQVQSKKKK